MRGWVDLGSERDEAVRCAIEGRIARTRSVTAVSAAEGEACIGEGRGSEAQVGICGRRG